MNKKMGIALIIIGFCILATGFYLTFYQKNTPEKTAINLSNQETLSKTDILEPSAAISENPEKEQVSNEINLAKNAETKESEEKGRKFEEYIVLKFDKRYFNIKEWRSDKFVKGIYAESNLYPDFEIAFSHKEIQETFAVECKWRKGFYKNGIDWAKEKQIEVYQKFQKDKNMPVFIILGIGGEPSSPENLFIIPLSAIKTVFLSTDNLKPYQKLPIDKNLFFDAKDKILK